MTAARKVIILGAGAPYRGRTPSLLSETDNHWSVLDWLAHAFSDLDAEMRLVGGYRVKDITRRYPDLLVSTNTEWSETGPVESLFTAPLHPQFEHFVCYSDTVFSRSAVALLADSPGDVVLAGDSTWRNRYQSRSASELAAAEKISAAQDRVTDVGQSVDIERAGAEFTGLMRLRSEAIRVLTDIRSKDREQYRTASIPALIKTFVENGLDVRWADVGSDWAELNAPADLSRFVLGTKAETLERLRPLVTKCRIGEQVKISLREWRAHPELCLDRIAAQFKSESLIFRSSASNEDGWNTANAGVYLSIPDVSGVDRKAWTSALDEVFASYGDDDWTHQVLVQEMIRDVAVSGVLFSRTLSFGGPYYSINYDETSSRSDTVTSGGAGPLKTLLVNRSCCELPDGCNTLLTGLLPAAQELEALVAHDTLDIEFIIGSDGIVHVVQIRPITVDHKRWRGGSDPEVGQLIATARETYKALARPGPFVLGEQPLYSNMSDWNPAEIIGTRPRPLAASLYRYLITDETWALQRSEYGYRDTRPQRLLVFFAGQPYVDVRASFNSFVPAVLSDEFAERLVEHYLARLIKSPSLHDKIEFDIVLTCTTLRIDESLAKLRRAGFSAKDADDLAAALCDITNRGFERVDGDLKTIEQLNQRRNVILNSTSAPLDRALGLLEDCRRLGALPFSHLARAGFVAMSILRSATAQSIISDTQMQQFLGSLETVATRFSNDAREVANGKRGWDLFVSDYGHLRPGTYEITSPCYKSAAERYLRPLVERAETAPREEPEFQWPDQTRKPLDSGLSGVGLALDTDQFDKFARAAIEGREYAKFCFTKNLSHALELISEFGASVGLDRDQLSYLELEDLVCLAGASAPSDVGAWCKRRSTNNRDNHTLAHGVELPPMIQKQSDFHAFHYPESHPNFVTAGAISAEVAVVAPGENADSNLEGMIVLIPQADPGFDWLFGHSIAGLITAYGGANSHMAIRAAEFGLPAAVGVGEQAYGRFAKANIIYLDCRNRQIEIVR